MSELTHQIRGLAVLGSTGSIGTQTLDVLDQHPGLYRMEVLTANENAVLLAQQARKFNAANAVICNPAKYVELKKLLEGTPTKVHSGMDAVCELVRDSAVDTVVTAMVGFGGLRSTMAAASCGKTIALANKETLVTAGKAVIATAASNGASILPVDSEHSAIFQCLQGNSLNRIARLHLTASGGPFRTWSRDRIERAAAPDALKHPNWNMGAKVTIDSATMMNKGLEVIEARWLFDVMPKDINVLVHPQSIIHSMVEFEDGAVIAQMGCPDMREPIQYALTWPRRLSLNNKRVDFTSLGQLDFEAPDLGRFPCLGIAFDAIGRGGTAPTAMNAANEVAVKAYLEGRIRFYDIADIISSVMDRSSFVSDAAIDDIFAVNDEASRLAKAML